jgi:RimJ/RimL family protein N-acetyltransferase
MRPGTLPGVRRGHGARSPLGSRVHLRQVVEADLPVLFEHQRDPDAVTMAHFPPRDRDAFMIHWRTRVLGSPTSTPRTIEVDGQVAGYVASWQPAEGPRELGYWLGRAYWGRGIASEAVKAFLSSCEPRRPLMALVAAHNVASRRVLEKCGFVAVGEPVIGADGVGEVTLRLA